jgi:streptogramin lyase
MEYEYTVNKIVTQGCRDFVSDEEARLYAARVKNIYQAEDPDNEYWFDYKVDATEPEQYKLQIVTDGAVTWTKTYDCALDAVHAYDKVVDYGFARFEREAVLIEPNGKTHTKIFQVPYGVAIA